MAMVNVDGSCQISADSQPNFIGLVQGLTATQRAVCIHQINQVNSCNGIQPWRQHHKYYLGYYYYYYPFYMYLLLMTWVRTMLSMWSLLQRTWWPVFTLTINWWSKPSGKPWASSAGISGSRWILIGYDITLQLHQITVEPVCRHFTVWYIVVHCCYHWPANQSCVVHLCTGWTKKLDWFWELITLRWLMGDRHVMYASICVLTSDISLDILLDLYIRHAALRCH